MPSNRSVLTLTGVSTTSLSQPVYFPDYSVRPFSLSIACVNLNSSAVYTVQHSNDYTGSSAFISTAATWFASTAATAITTNAFVTYSVPVTAISLVSTAGSSVSQVTATFLQAG